MAPNTSRPRTGNPELDQIISELVSKAEITDNLDLVSAMLGTVTKLGIDGHSRGDLKLANAAFRELRNAYNSFEPYHDRLKCSIFGSARTTDDEPAYLAAQEVGKALTEAGWMTITGGGPGIMTAGVEGAGTESSFAVTIRLPFEPMEGGGIVPDERMVRFRYFFTRKLMFMKESSAYVCLPGGFGTMDETFELLTLMQTGKEYPAPVVLFEPVGDRYWETWSAFVTNELIEAKLVSPEDLDLVRITSSASEAVQFIVDFYEYYHSMRYVNGQLIIRLNKDISDATLARLQHDFEDMLEKDTIRRCEPTSFEIDDNDNVDLPRLSMWFDQRHFARLHQCIRSLGND